MSQKESTSASLSRKNPKTFSFLFNSFKNSKVKITRWVLTNLWALVPPMKQNFTDQTPNVGEQSTAGDVI